jgi:PP-loop superfamily ATP-utilizing enzyme
MFEEDLDEVKFVKEFTEATIKNWKGLKLSYLEDLMLVDLKGQDPEKLMEFTFENARVLVENSNEFDNWLNEVVFDLENFRSGSQGANIPKAESSS